MHLNLHMTWCRRVECYGLTQVKWIEIKAWFISLNCRKYVLAGASIEEMKRTNKSSLKWQYYRALLRLNYVRHYECGECWREVRSECGWVVDCPSLRDMRSVITKLWKLTYPYESSWKELEIHDRILAVIKVYWHRK